MRFSIRAAREEDAASMVALLNPIIREGIHTAMQAEVTVAEQVEFLRGFPARGVFHVAVDTGGGDVLGMQDVVPASAESALAHVGEVSTFVSLLAHRQGLGRSLCEATFRAARGLGFTQLRATIRGDNPAAIAFYRSQGFRVVGVAGGHVQVAEKLLE